MWAWRWARPWDSRVEKINHGVGGVGKNKEGGQK